jgi:competence protein ComGF
MKKLLLISIIALTLASCKKDEVNSDVAKNCKCFTVSKKETVTTVVNLQIRTWESLTLQNICDRIEITRLYTTNQASNIRVGDRVCD